jgi:glycosyltransferase involved in cell wall biosynthesis
MGITPTLPLTLHRVPKPDIVHVFGFRDVVTTITAAWCRARRIPYVFEPLDMIVPQFRNVPVKRAFDRVLGVPVVRGARLVIANSQRERAQLVTAGVDRERIVVRPNGFPPVHNDRGSILRSTLGISADVPLVLNVGRLSFKKGLDVLLEAVASMPGVQLAIVGPDDGDGTRSLLERRASMPDLAGRVGLLPPFDDRQPRELYGEADVFVLPSRNESFGMVAAEAAAAGVAIVLTDQCGVAEMLAGAAVVVPVDAVAIREAIDGLLADTELRERLGTAGQSVASATSWDAVVDLQEALYSRVLAR